MFKKLLAIICLIFVLMYLLGYNNRESLITKDYHFITKNANHYFKLKIANTSYKHAKGLMNVNYLPENEGMIFINSKPTVSAFWMKNTYISLDIIFIDELSEIVYIHKNATPLDEHQIISWPYEVSYVVEINGGLCDKLNIRVGDHLQEIN